MTLSADVIQKAPYIVQIIVKDTGIGIKEEDQKKLFQNFTKIDLGDKALMNSSGCGLGLSFANKLAMALGRGIEDHIKVESKLGEGSVFSFCVIDKPPRSGSYIEPFDPKPKETFNDIDYNEDFEENIRSNPRSQAEAEVSYKKGMPRMDGLEATKKMPELLSKREGLSEKVAIIGTTAQNDQVTNQYLNEGGMNEEVVVKSVAKETLTQLLGKYQFLKQEA